jgi:hypothetical protein
MAGVGVYEELGNESRLNQGVAIVSQRGDETARVDGQVFGRARDGKINENGVELKTQFAESNLRTMSPRAKVGAVESDLGGHFVLIGVLVKGLEV